MKMVIPIDPYGYDLNVFSNRDEFMEFIDSKKFDDPPTTSDVHNSNGFCFTPAEHNAFIIGVFDGKISTLVHEISHAIISLFEYIEIPINDACSEAFTYLLGHLIEKSQDVIE